ncbi:hypothetical protein RRG08_004675 [Elysia crispata]|uniref:Uncharacterized protein n=1 Tax=Elysia crispata TaxID=231223 RepID=A0AAE1ABF2_9GAST|nr:hypothetical protein RRG08_004675 [Elysia crispata]
MTDLVAWANRLEFHACSRAGSINNGFSKFGMIQPLRMLRPKPVQAQSVVKPVQTRALPEPFSPRSMECV